MLLLLLVLLPGVGHTVNGSTRWVRFGVMNIQVSEPARLCMFMYLAGYLVRRNKSLREEFRGFLRPMLVLCVACVLLLSEPDFGAAIVLLAAALVMMFVAGARWRDFTIFFGVAAIAMTSVAVNSHYRLRRLTGFLDPWADPFDTGFQLTQSLIAIGRGEWLGVGLGNSVQKLFYLPEAHTDFVFAVFAEEFGLLGALLLIMLFLALVWRIFCLAIRASDVMAIVLLAAALVMMFVAGARWRDFTIFFGVAAIAMTSVAVNSHYRLRRFVARRYAVTTPGSAAGCRSHC